jgi:DNA-binding MarR family transcriptional regulator
MNKWKAGTPPVSKTEEMLLFRVIATSREVEGRVERALGEAGLSLAKAGVLHTLTRAGGSLPLGSLAESNKCVRSNVTQLVDRLEAEGLVERQNDPDDRRVRRAVLTDAGAKAYVESARILNREEEALVSSLTERELEGLMASLERLVVGEATPRV